MSKKDIIIALIITVCVVVFITPFSSQLPDGLQKVAQDKGFIEKEKSALNAPLAGYSWPGINSQKASMILSGIFGAMAAFLMIYGLGLIIRGRKNQK